MTIDMLCASAVVCGHVRLVGNRERSIQSSLGNSCGPTIALFGIPNGSPNDFLCSSLHVAHVIMRLLEEPEACDNCVV